MTIRKVYIDGYNLLRKVVRYDKLMKSNADAARRSFVESLRAKIPRGAHATIVFDGAGEAIGGGNPFRVVFSLTRSADNWIRTSLEKENNPRTVLVVSSDHEVQNHARACGAMVSRSEDFLSSSFNDAVSEEEKPESGTMSSDELSMWKKIFSESRSEDDE
jgi:predicted RNA-binding protein with PIN domain